MNTLLLYVTTVFVWGASWIAIKAQGSIDPELSVIYRFVIAAACMFFWCWAKSLPIKFTKREHFFIAMQGVFLFSTNFFFFYHASYYLTTGLLAVVFSMASTMTLIIRSVLLRQLPQPFVVVGVLMGATGIGLIFWPEIQTLDLEASALKGLVLSIFATCCFSVGSVFSARNQSAGISVRGGSAWGMVYGVIWLNILLLFRGGSYHFDYSVTYVSALLFLAMFATVVGFACYFALQKRVGAEQAAYTTVLFPIVALAISTVIEDYQWSLLAFSGVAMTLLGNFFVLSKR
ncbi:DMT family transporter [Alphaproteobacteria bacterium]|nr:DMT family transporter [Alphaproteobacteria bacterium]